MLYTSESRLWHVIVAGCLAILILSPRQASADQFTRSAVDDLRRGATTSELLDIDTIISPGIEAGVTGIDQQHHTSQGHQIGINPGGNTVHLAWTYSLLPGGGDRARSVHSL